MLGENAQVPASHHQAVNQQEYRLAEVDVEQGFRGGEFEDLTVLVEAVETAFLQIDQRLAQQLRGRGGKAGRGLGVVLVREPGERAKVAQEKFGDRLTKAVADNTAGLADKPLAPWDRVKFLLLIAATVGVSLLAFDWLYGQFADLRAEFQAHIDEAGCPFGDSSPLRGVVAPVAVHAPLPTVAVHA